MTAAAIPTARYPTSPRRHRCDSRRQGAAVASSRRSYSPERTPLLSAVRPRRRRVRAALRKPDYGHRRRAAPNDFSLPVFLRRCPYIISSTNSTHLNSRSWTFSSCRRYSGIRIVHGRVNTFDPRSWPGNRSDPAWQANRSTTWSASVKTSSIEPRLIVEARHVDDERVTLPAANRLAHPRVDRRRLRFAHLDQHGWRSRTHAMRMSLLPVCRI